MLRFRWETLISDTTDTGYENVFEIEKIPKGWKRKKLEHIAELRREHFLPKDRDIRLYVGLGHIEKGTLTLENVGKSEEVISSKFIFKKGDILFGKLRPYFRKVILAPFDGVCSTDILVIKPKRNTCNKYLFYLLASKQIIDSVSTASEGTKMPRVSWSFLKHFEINVPSYEEQNRIGEVLSWFDDLIENKKRQNEILEKTAMAIFKRWFVGFEPFKDGEFVESEIGKIPKGWEVKNLGEAIDTQYGFTASAEEEGEVNLLRIMDINKTFVIDWDNVPYCKVQKRDLDKYLLKDKDIVISRIADIGKVAIVEDPPIAVFASYLIRLMLKPKPTITPYYLYYWLKSATYQSYILYAGDGSTRQNTNAKVIKSGLILLPREDVIKKYTSVVKKLRKKIINNQNQIMILRKIRDALLPLLVFGKLRVEEI